jgi:hypothetical protein
MLEFEWVVGDAVGKLTLCQPTGASGAIQLVINNFYQGQVVRYNEEWIFYLNSTSEINSYEILMLREALNNEF